MIIDFESGRIPKQLARKLQSKVEEWGDTLKYTHALMIVSRMFGHEDYNALNSRLGLADPSVPDGEACSGEREQRYRQYVGVLSENDFSVEEAEIVVNTVYRGKWWGFNTERPYFDPQEANIQAAGEPIEFRDEGIVGRLRRVLKASIKETGVEPSVGVRHLMAKMFGHQTFDSLMASAAKGNPSVPDYQLSPEALDRRVAGYLSILESVGFDRENAMKVLQKGEGGWLGIKENEWGALRQSRRADRLEHGWRPRWRPRRLVREEEEVPLPGQYAGESSTSDERIQPRHGRSRLIGQADSYTSQTIQNIAKQGPAMSHALSVEELQKRDPQLAADLESVSLLKMANKRKEREPGARLLVGFIAEDAPRRRLNVPKRQTSAAEPHVDTDVVGRAGPSLEPKA